MKTLSLNAYLLVRLKSLSHLILIFLLSQAFLSRSEPMYVWVRRIQTHLSITCVLLQCGGLAGDAEQHPLLPHLAILSARLCVNRSVKASWKTIGTAKITWGFGLCNVSVLFWWSKHKLFKLFLDFIHVDQPTVGRDKALVVVFYAQEFICPGA